MPAAMRFPRSPSLVCRTKAIARGERLEKSVRNLDIDQYFPIANKNKLKLVRIQNPLTSGIKEIRSVLNNEVERSPPPSSDAELCELLLRVRRGEVIHPQLKRLLIHLGFAEPHGLMLALTGKARRLLEV
jgi:hypothetical protein